MKIVPQMKLFEESDFENLGDLERLQMLLETLDDEKLISSAGLYLSLRMHFIQLHKFPYSLNVSINSINSN